MRKEILIMLVAILLLTGCNGKKKKRYDPYKYNPMEQTITKGFDISFEKESGVRTIMVNANGVMGIKAIFDSGCSTMLISQLELQQLIKHGTVSESDISVGYFTIADGETKQLPQVRLQVSLVDSKGEEHVTSVDAAVVEDLSASALVGNAVFGNLANKITIDDSNNIIHFE